MIGDWLAYAGLAGLALLVVFGPGLVIGAALRLRGLVLAAAAPGISVGYLSGLAVVFPMIGVRWGLAQVAIAVFVAAVVAFVLGRFLTATPVPATSRASRLVLAGGIVVGSILLATRLLTYIGVPWAISQTNDAVFHLNALRWIAETGSASSLTLGGVLGPSTFYPGAWHAIASLVVVTPDALPVAVNMVALVIAAGIWPLGIALLTRVVTGDSAAAGLAAALAAAMLAFPQLMFAWGVLYPYALSVALVPATVAVTILAVRPEGWSPRFDSGAARPRSASDTLLVERAAGESKRRDPRVGLTLTAAAGVVGIALAQPASLLVWGILSLIWLTGEILPRLRTARAATGSSRRAMLMLAGLAGAWLVLALVWLQFAVFAGAVLWDPYLSVLGAVRDVALNSQGALPAAPGISILLCAGLVVAVRAPGLRWFAIAWALFSVLYIVSVATSIPIVTRALTGPWYGDSYRLAAVTPVLVVPLAAMGLAAVLRWFAQRIRSEGARERAPLWGIAVIAAVVTAGVMVAPVIQLRVAHTTDPQSRYALNDDSYLSRDAYALLRRLPETVPADALLIGNPSTGAGFAYALGERDVIPRTWAKPESEAWDVIADGLHDAGEDPAVCDALALYGHPGFVLDFGVGDKSPGRYPMPGMTGFDGRPGFELVDREGEASLWEITACR